MDGSWLDQLDVEDDAEHSGALLDLEQAFELTLGSLGAGPGSQTQLDGGLRAAVQAAAPVVSSAVLPAGRGAPGRRLLQRLDRRIARLFGCFETLLGAGEILLELGAQSLLGLQRGLGPTATEVRSLARLPLLPEFALEHRPLLPGFVLYAIGAVYRRLRALIGMLSATLGSLSQLLGALSLPARTLGVLPGGVSFKLAATNLLDRTVSLLLGLSRPRDCGVALSLSLVGPAFGVLGALFGLGRRGLGRRLSGHSSVGARQRVRGGALCILRPRLRLGRQRVGLPLPLAGRSRTLLGVVSRGEGRLGRIVGLHPLTPRGGLELRGATHLGLRIGSECRELGLELLGVGQDPQRLTRALHVGNQARRHRPEGRARQADGPIPPTPLCALVRV